MFACDWKFRLLAVMTFVPGARSTVDEQVHVPSGRTMVTHRVWEPDVTVTL